MVADRKDLLKRKLELIKEGTRQDIAGSAYTVHMVNTSTKKKLTTIMKELLDAEHPSKIIGALIEEDDHLAIEGCSSKHSSFIKLVKRQMKTVASPLLNFVFTNTL